MLKYNPPQVSQLTRSEPECGIYLYGDTPAERGQLREILKECRAEKFFWGVEDMLRVLDHPGGLLFYAAAQPAVAPWQGFVFVEAGPYSCDLLYIYCAKAARRTGLGRLLLNFIIEHLAARGEIEHMFLEVRVSNLAAKALYESFGMRRVGVRERYYSDGEDAEVYEYNFATV
jgi:ribosomal protein S18 acetylase RimI-like enzyme